MMDAANDNNDNSSNDNNANDNRPAAFDDAVLAYLPRLLKVAARLQPSERDDLVQATVETALKCWKSYNPAKNLGGWLVFQMRNINFKWLSSKRPRGTDAALEFLAVEPTQQDYMDADDILRTVEASPHAAVLNRLAMGDTMEEVAARFGVSKQRVHQKVVEFRRSARAV